MASGASHATQAISTVSEIAKPLMQRAPLFMAKHFQHIQRCNAREPSILNRLEATEESRIL